MYRILMITVFLWNLTEEEANAALRYLKYDNKTREVVVKILRFRSEPVTADRVRIKQAMNRMGQETWQRILELRDAAIDSRVSMKHTDGDFGSAGSEAQVRNVRAMTEDILEQGEPFTTARLAVNGSDLIKSGIPAGKKIGEILENILQKVMQSPTLNKKEILCEYARELYDRR